MIKKLLPAKDLCLLEVPQFGQDSILSLICLLHSLHCTKAIASYFKVYTALTVKQT